MKKIIRKLSSMQFAILVLILTGLVSIIGSLIPQNRALEFYHLTYGHGWGDWIDRLGLSRMVCGSRRCIVLEPFLLCRRTSPSAACGDQT